MKSWIMCVPLLAILFACGNRSDNLLLDVTKELANSAAKEKAPAPSMAQQRAALVERARKAGNSQPILLVELPQAGAVASLSIVGQNNGAISWIDPTGVSVVTRRGVVIATRGLGFDLMSSDTRGTMNALRGGASGYSRFHRYLNGEGLPQDITFSCSAARGGGQISETCTNPDGSFTNSYQLRGSEVVQSRQWLGRQIGYASITRLQ